MLGGERLPAEESIHYDRPEVCIFVSYQGLSKQPGTITLLSEMVLYFIILELF